MLKEKMLQEIIKTKELCENEYNRIKEELDVVSKDEKVEKEKYLDNIRRELIDIDKTISEHSRDNRKMWIDVAKTILTTLVSLLLTMKAFQFDMDFTSTSTLGKGIFGSLLKQLKL